MKNAPWPKNCEWDKLLRTVEFDILRGGQHTKMTKYARYEAHGEIAYGIVEGDQVTLGAGLACKVTEVRGRRVLSIELYLEGSQGGES